MIFILYDRFNHHIVIASFARTCVCHYFLIYRRIFLFKFIFKELRIPLLDIKDIIDKGSKIPKVSTRSLVLATFFKPYERILIKMKSGKEYKIFVDADPYSFRNYDDNKFIKNYNELKEMVIEEQSKLSFNKKI